jgi:hypothetical protein
MRLAPVLVGAVALALATVGYAETRPKKPHIALRAAPRIVMSPARVLAIVELVGGEDVEEFYCPGLEWDWGDGSRSYHEEDCAPFEVGAQIQRRYSASHVYSHPGDFSVRVSFRRAEHTLVTSSTQILVRGYVAGLEP